VEEVLSHGITNSSTELEDDGGDDEGDDSDNEDDDGVLEDRLVDTYLNSMHTFNEHLDNDISLIRNFLNGLEYQRQFGDHHMLESLGCNGARFFCLMRNFLDHECHLDSSQASSPTTWEYTTANAM
jgi:hypothetical protein